MAPPPAADQESQVTAREIALEALTERLAREILTELERDT
jgi:hypothetical protein